MVPSFKRGWLNLRKSITCDGFTWFAVAVAIGSLIAVLLLKEMTGRSQEHAAELNRLRNLLFSRTYCEGNQQLMYVASCRHVGCWYREGNRCKVSGDILRGEK